MNLLARLAGLALVASATASTALAWVDPAPTVVKTISIRPDGSMAAAVEAPAATQATETASKGEKDACKEGGVTDGKKGQETYQSNSEKCEKPRYDLAAGAPTADAAAYPDETQKGMGAVGSAADYRAGYNDLMSGQYDPIETQQHPGSAYSQGVNGATRSLGAYADEGSHGFGLAAQQGQSQVANIGNVMGADARDAANYYQQGWAGKTRDPNNAHRYVTFEEGAETHTPYGWTPEAERSDFGARESVRTLNGNHSSHNHMGVDYAQGPAYNGKAMAQSTVDGKVIFAGKKGGYGNTVLVQDANGNVTQYSHLASMNVTSGQQVGVGYNLGTVGKTGNSTGPHLHYGEISDGGYVNPATSSIRDYNPASVNAWTSNGAGLSVPTTTHTNTNTNTNTGGAVDNIPVASVGNGGSHTPVVATGGDTGLGSGLNTALNTLPGLLNGQTELNGLLGGTGLTGGGSLNQMLAMTLAQQLMGGGSRSGSGSGSGGPSPVTVRPVDTAGLGVCPTETVTTRTSTTNADGSTTERTESVTRCTNGDV